MSSNSINQHLAEMRAAGKVTDYKAKGNAGELAAVDVVHAYYMQRGGILRHGFMYPYATNHASQMYLGNIFWDEEQKKYTTISRKSNDEIDILYISHFNIIPIEVKAYHDKSILIKDDWMWRRNQKVDKSPIAQVEKHARHLYHQLYDVIPNGDSKYIRPVVCFVDECSVNDKRSPSMMQYIPVCVLDGLKSTLCKIDVQGAYTLDLEMIEKKLRAIESERTI